MKKTLLLLLMAMCVNTAALAQFSVRCQVNDSTGEGEPYATVRITTIADTSRAVATGVTGLNGSFKQELTTAGNYVLKVSAVGKTTITRGFEVTATSPHAQLGTLVLKSASNELAGVMVTAQAPLVTTEIDRLSYNVQSDEESKTKTIFDLLRKVPLVTIDGQENVKVKGSGNFKIYKNGRPDPSMSHNPKEVLKSIPAHMIKKVEVITEPGAKYDAEGVAAILNIVTVDNVAIHGVAGTVDAGVNNYGSPHVGTYLTTQVGKIITSINYGYRHNTRNKLKQHQNGVTRYNHSGNTLSNWNENNANVNVHYGNIESSFEPDTLNLFTLSFGGYYYDYNGEAAEGIKMVNPLGETLYRYNSMIKVPMGSYYSFDGRFDYQHKTHVKNETLTLSYLLSTSRTHNQNEYSYSDMFNVPFPYRGYNNDSRENFWEHTLQFDWTRPFAKYHKIETGLKYIHRINKSHSLMNYLEAENLNTDTRFNHLTQVGAAYLSYTFAKNSWAARAGLRYEYSFLNAKYPDGSQANYHSRLSDWVPSASINYQFNMANSLKLAFATRINRPGIQYLNPAVEEQPNSKSFGNSHLSSSRGYSTSLTYMHIGAKFTFNLTPSYSISNNQIGSVTWVENDKTVSTYDNILRSRYGELSSYVQWQVFEGTSFIFNGSLGYQTNENRNLHLKGEGWNISVFSQLTQSLPWKLRLTLGGGYWKSAPGLYGHDSGSNWYNLGLQRSFLKEDRLTVSLNASYPFSGRYNCYTSYYDRGDYTGMSQGYYTNRSVDVSVSYRFGSLKASVKKTNTTIQNTDLVGSGRKN